MTQSAENGTPIPTRQQYEFAVIHGCYICSGCGSLVGSRIANVRQHEAWHDELYRIQPVTQPGSGGES